MFTGLVEEIGRVVAIRPEGTSLRLVVECATIRDGLAGGDSISVDGCCLTVETLEPGGFSAFASPETLAKTSLGERRPGDGVNLERAMALGERLGGHIVSGHVDATGVFGPAVPHGESWEIRIAAPRAILSQCIAKGSITVDGISLTIVDLTEQDFSCWIIPETWTRTTLHERRPGQRVNLETDLIGKYVFRFLEAGNGEKNVDAKDAEGSRSAPRNQG